MTFLTLILKNLLRRRSRSLLTIIGIAIGIAAVVALTSLAWGFENTLSSVYKARGTDLIVTKASSHSAIPSAFPAKIKDDLLAIPKIDRVAGILCELFSVEDRPAIIVVGWEPDTPVWTHLKLVQGNWLPKNATNQVMMGVLLAESMGKKVGDTVQIEASEFTVNGIFSSSAFTENGAIVMFLPEMQRLTNREGLINFVDVWLDAATSEQQREELPGLVRNKCPGLAAFSPGAVVQNAQTIQIMKAMSFATSILALVVGAVGVMNTILMSVFERLQEIGVLLAIGWRRARILKMILLESVVLSFLGGVAGSILGLVGTKILQATPTIHGKIEGEISLPLLGLGMLVALALGTLGGFYPAWIGSRMSPATALRQ